MDSKNDKLMKLSGMDFNLPGVMDNYIHFYNNKIVQPGDAEKRTWMLGFENKEKDENSSDVPELTIEVINKKIKQYEILTGMSFNEYKRACESGKIKNFSQVGLDLWELIEEQKKEIEQKEINTNE